MGGEEKGVGIDNVDGPSPLNTYASIAGGVSRYSD